MKEIFEQVVLVNLYWVTLPIIGYASLTLLKRRFSHKVAISQVTEFVDNQPILAQVFMYFGAAVSLLSIVTMLSYMLHLPVMVLASFYELVLLISLGVVALQIGHNLFSTRRLSILNTGSDTLLARIIFYGLIALIGVDFILNLYTGGHAADGSDTYVHLSRIVLILNKGFSTESGFFAGIPETGYHYNLVYALYVLPSYILHISPTDIWRYSFAFLKLMQWLAVFSLSWHVAKNWLKLKSSLLFSSLTTFFAVSAFSSGFYIASYPSQIVNIWFVMLVLMISAYDLYGRAFGLPIVLVALLITMTHPTYALMAATFVVMIALTKILTGRKAFLADKSGLIIYGTALCVLMIGPLRTVLYQTHLNSAQTNLDNFATLKYSLLSMKKPIFLYPGLMSKLVTLLSLVGFMYLLWKLWGNRSQWIVALVLICFFPLLVYEPVGFTILSKVLPDWVIGRFNAMNILRFIGIPIGIYGLLDVLNQSILRLYPSLRGMKDRMKLTTRAQSVVLAIAVVGLSCNFLINLPGGVLRYRDLNTHAYTFMDKTQKDFKSNLGGEKIVVANTGDSYFLPSILPVHTIAIAEGHATPAADITDRLKCQKVLMSSFGYADLSAVDASYVVLSTYSPDYQAQRATADSKSYLHVIAQDSNFYVYSFVKNSSSDKLPVTPNLSCTQFLHVEK